MKLSKGRRGFPHPVTHMVVNGGDAGGVAFADATKILFAIRFASYEERTAFANELLATPPCPSDPCPSSPPPSPSPT